MTSGFDNYQDCKDILGFYDRGTASHFEAAIINALVIADHRHVERIALAFPVLVQAFHDKQKGYDNQSETHAT